MYTTSCNLRNDLNQYVNQTWFLSKILQLDMMIIKLKAKYTAQIYFLQREERYRHTSKLFCAEPINILYQENVSSTQVLQTKAKPFGAPACHLCLLYYMSFMGKAVFSVLADLAYDKGMWEL